MQRAAVWSVVLVLAAVVGQGFSQGDDEGKGPSRRLPNFYSKVGLRQSQRDTIYGIQDKYAEQIEDLIRQVEEIRHKRDAEIEMVLNDEQRIELKKLRTEAAAAKVKPRKSSAEAKPATEAKPTTAAE